MNRRRASRAGHPIRTRARQRGRRGVVLLEVLVALSILGIGLTAVVGGLRSGWVALQRAETARQATRLLEEIADDPAWRDPGMPRAATGRRGAFTWRVERLPLGSRDAAARGLLARASAAAAADGDRRPGAATLQRLEVSLAWEAAGRSRELRTVRWLHVQRPARTGGGDAGDRP